MTKKARVSKNIKTIVLLLILLVYLVPFILVVVNSFKPTKEFLENPLILPQVFSLSNFAVAFEKMNFLNGLSNTAVITSISVLLIALFSAMAAYLMVRSSGKAVKFLFFCMVSAMIIPFQALMVPLVKIYGSLGILNNQATLIYMYLGFGAPMAVFIYHGFIKSVPLEIEEAAMIDGCSRIRTFFDIVFPLVKPISFTVIILDVLWIWNDFLLPSLVLIKPLQRTLPLSTFYFFGTYTVDYGLLMAGLLMTILPVIVIYLFLQKYIIQGVMQGSIK
jgi:raffinose/stachyose/melibiose transport system permease protein